MSAVIQKNDDDYKSMEGGELCTDKNESKTKGCLSVTPYLDAEACENARNFRYRCEDLGICYIYFLSPLAARIAECLPRWLTANAITMIGTFFNLGPIVWVFSMYGLQIMNDTKNPIPNWVWLMQALFYFIYRICDEVDGKQARRIGQSSGLGCLFDHSVDALAASFQPLIFARAIQLGPSLLTLAPILVVSSVFQVNAMEQYYSGALRLLPGNGVSDGSIFLYAMYICCGIFTNNFYATPSFVSGLTYGELFGLAIAIYQFIVLLTTMREIYIYQYATHGEDDPVGETMVMKDVFKQVMAWTLVVLSTVGLAIICRFPAMTNNKTPETNEQKTAQFFMILMIWSTVTAHINISLHFAYVVKQKYTPLPEGKLQMFVVAASLATFVTGSVLKYWGNSHQKIDNILSIALGTILTVCIVSFFHQIIFVFNEMADAIGIRIFISNPPKEQKLLEDKQEQ